MNLSLAPIQGMTTANYRNHFHRIFGGIDTYYTPFITTTKQDKCSKALFKDADRTLNDKDIDLIPQLLGNSGQDFKVYAKVLVEMGYTTINWNIGCPYPMITKRKRGSGILPYPEMISAFMETVCDNKNYKLTVKMRLGLESMDEGPKVMAVLNDYPIHEVIIHGRIGAQKYTGTVDLVAFDNLLQLSKHDVIYNGDIFTVEDYMSIIQRFPKVKGIMLGRGALYNPFLPSMIAGKVYDEAEKYEMLRLFHKAIFDHYQSILSGDTHLLHRMKEFWSYTGQPLDPSGKAFKQIKKSKTLTAYQTAVNHLLRY